MTRPSWVEARAACTLASLFAALCEAIERDVAEARAAPSSSRRDPYAYSVRSSENALAVTREPTGRAQDALTVVQIRMGEEAIRLQYELPGGQWKNNMAWPAWDARTMGCALLMDDDRYEPWQLSMRLLYPLFFEPTRGD